MGLFGRRKETRAEQLMQADDTLLRAMLSGGEITEETALSIPALSAGVGFVADLVAGLPVKLCRDTPGKKSEELAEDVRAYLLNNEGGDLLDSYEMKRAQIRDMLLFGAGYLHISRSGNSVTGLRYVDRRSVSVSMNADPIYKEAAFSVNGRTYYPWDFVILARNSRNGVTGSGLLRQIGELLSTLRNEMQYESSNAKTGGNKKGVLQSERKLSKDAIAELKTAWRDLYSNNGNNMMVLNDGVKFAPSSNTSAELQLNENKLTNAELIAQCMGLNTAVIGGRATTEEFMSAVRTGVLPVVEAYQSALDRALLLESEKRSLYFVLDTTELLKGDLVSRYNAYAVGLRNNFLQIDEVRYKEDLPPLGFNYIKLGLQDVLLDPKTGAVYTPNTNQMVNVNAQGGLTVGAESGIIEERERHWTKGDHGYFTGSYSDGGGSSGGKTLDKSGGSGIMNTGSGEVTISSIDSPIEHTHDGKGNPNGIIHLGKPLSGGQRELLDALPEYDSRVTVPKSAVNMADLSALTAVTGDEFAMFTKGGERLIVRGSSYKVNINIEEAKILSKQGYRWSGHTHPGTNDNCMTSSPGDHLILECFAQNTSVIYNSKGQFRTFEKES